MSFSITVQNLAGDKHPDWNQFANGGHRTIWAALDDAGVVYGHVDDYAPDEFSQPLTDEERRHKAQLVYRPADFDAWRAALDAKLDLASDYGQAIRRTGLRLIEMLEADPQWWAGFE